MGALANITPAPGVVPIALPTGKLDTGWMNLSTGAIGAAPNSAGMSVSGGVFNLEPANASFGGVVTTSTQTFAGAKTFSSPVVCSDATEATSPSAAAQTVTGGIGVGKRSFLGAIGASFKGNVFAGVQDATAAIAGQVGENISSTVTGVAAAASGVVGNVTSIALTAGDWLISARAVVSGGATGLTPGSLQKLSVVTASATNGVEGSTMQNTSIYALMAAGKHALCLPHLRVNINATTTYYLTSEVTYAGGSPTCAGSLVATRLR